MNHWSSLRARLPSRHPLRDAAQADAVWAHKQHAARRWGLAGGLMGALLAVLAFAPAAWLAGAVASATGERLLLTDARGTVWSGSAVAVLTGGPESRDAAALPGRLHWLLRPSGLALELRARQACCLNGEMALRLQPGFGRFQATLLPPSPEAAAAGGTIGQWPAAWLAGLGTPWNTLQLGGTLRLASPGLSLEWVQGRSRFTGEAMLDLASASSRVVTLDTLGSYRMSVRGDASSGDASTLTLATLEGALRLSGQGQWSGGRVRFRGSAQAAPGSEAALSNLLNIIGRRQGAASVISIG